MGIRPRDLVGRGKTVNVAGEGLRGLSVRGSAVDGQLCAGAVEIDALAVGEIKLQRRAAVDGGRTASPGDRARERLARDGATSLRTLPSRRKTVIKRVKRPHVAY